MILRDIKLRHMTGLCHLFIAVIKCVLYVSGCVACKKIVCVCKCYHKRRELLACNFLLCSH